jgi:thiol-disulfide isomerase/thioredoxin
MSTAVIAIVAGLALAGLTGWLLTHRSGVLAETRPGSGRLPAPDTSDLELADGGPTVVHFSAPWCGPCAAVRRVVTQVCTDLGGVAHVEIDIDTKPATARKLSVLSLPTTVIFDAHGRQRYRVTGVPAAADLRSALAPLLA